jgi:hypothetical protein
MYFGVDSINTTEKQSYNGNYINDFSVATTMGEMLIEVLNTKFKPSYNLIHTEGLNDFIARLLDKYSGIDALLKNEKDLAGVALRIQKHSEKNWKTFTIRYSRHTGTETEYEKRKRQIYNSYPSFYPHYTCQAYYSSDNTLLGGAFVPTKDLFDIAKQYEPFNTNSTVYIQKNTSDNNTFIVVPFSEFKENRILIF